jgi:hypothetical protein
MGRRITKTKMKGGGRREEGTLLAGDMVACHGGSVSVKGDFAQVRVVFFFLKP